MKYYLVEDELIIRKNIESELKSLGREVIGQASSEDVAFIEIVDLIPDVVISDITLSPGNGVQLMKRVRECRDIRFLILTGLPLDIELMKELDIPGVMFASKPIYGLSRFIEIIEEMPLQ